MAAYNLDLEQARDAAVAAARMAGDVVRDFAHHRRTIAATAARALRDESGDGAAAPPARGRTEIAARHDKRCDEAVVRSLRRFSEEVGRRNREAGLEAFDFCFITAEAASDAPLTCAPTWIVEPIDSTASFVHGGCDCCVSIGLAINKQTVLAVVYCPFLTGTRNAMTGLSSSSKESGEMYTAIRGKGAFLNGQPIRVCGEAVPTTALVAFNYPMGARLSDVERSLDAAQADAIKQQKHRNIVEASGHIRERLALQNVQGIRSYGACVFILAQIAAGRVDLYMEPSGMVWDVCAGSLLVTEAGGTVTNIWGGEFGLEDTTTIIAAANRELADYGAQLCAEVNYGDYWKK